MKRLIIYISILLIAALMAIGYVRTEVPEGSKVNPTEIIFEHLGDAYGWELPFNHDLRIPLPIIVRAEDGSWHCFSSSRVAHGAVYDRFAIGGEGSAYKGKVVELRADGTEYRPFDFSITKNVAALIVTVIIVSWIFLSLTRYYRRNGMKAPRKFKGAVEALVDFIYVGIVKPMLKEKASKFAPYLMTVFMFVFVANLLGLVVIFPGGANLTGNIAITMVLALFTFFMTNVFGTKHYWKDIFWPDVPLWLKFPIPIMPVIEVFGVFTKPAALTVRLFANMMGGHMIVIVLTLLIFIFAAMNIWVGAATSVVSILFSVFMLLIDVLVSFIQAFVFTMLSTLFISLAQEGGHHEEAIKE
ncbi:MAG: F0F1 ATP synthase subunit A [Muribaculaceae bacterium]|nr:F0F1 ATP synthase subunit A [Muribaculaceae bacterium]